MKQKLFLFTLMSFSLLFLYGQNDKGKNLLIYAIDGTKSMQKSIDDLNKLNICSYLPDTVNKTDVIIRVLYGFIDFSDTKLDSYFNIVNQSEIKQHCTIKLRKTILNKYYATFKPEATVYYVLQNAQFNTNSIFKKIYFVAVSDNQTNSQLDYASEFISAHTSITHHFVLDTAYTKKGTESLSVFVYAFTPVLTNAISRQFTMNCLNLRKQANESYYKDILQLDIPQNMDLVNFNVEYLTSSVKTDKNFCPIRFKDKLDNVLIKTYVTARYKNNSNGYKKHLLYTIDKSFLVQKSNFTDTQSWFKKQMWYILTITFLIIFFLIFYINRMRKIRKDKEVSIRRLKDNLKACEKKRAKTKKKLIN